MLAGFLAKRRDGSQSSPEWGAVRTLYPRLDYFKMSEAWGCAANFCNDVVGRNRFGDGRIQILDGIIAEHALSRISASIENSDFNNMPRSIRAIERNNATDSPYVHLTTRLFSS